LARQLGDRLVDPSEAIFWIRFPTPEVVSFAETAKPRLVVYEVVDDHENSPGMNDRLRRVFRAAERRILALAGLLFVSSDRTPWTSEPLAPLPERPRPFPVPPFMPEAQTSGSTPTC
jgi:hypothetical protein